MVAKTRIPQHILLLYGTRRYNQLSADELKQIWIDKMVALDGGERWRLILSLEAQLNLDHLSLRSYLVLIGVAGYSSEDLQPYDIGHVVRYLRISVPVAVPAILRTMFLAGFDLT